MVMGGHPAGAGLWGGVQQGRAEPRAQRKRDTQHLPPTSELSNPFPGLRMGNFSASVSEGGWTPGQKIRGCVLAQGLGAIVVAQDGVPRGTFCHLTMASNLWRSTMARVFPEWASLPSASTLPGCVHYWRGDARCIILGWTNE